MDLSKTIKKLLHYILSATTEDIIRGYVIYGEIFEPISTMTNKCHAESPDIHRGKLH
jgi:hypothetical protein